MGVVMHGEVDLLVNLPLSVSKRFVPGLALCWELYAGTKRFEWIKGWFKLTLYRLNLYASCGL